MQWITTILFKLTKKMLYILIVQNKLRKYNSAHDLKIRSVSWNKEQNSKTILMIVVKQWTENIIISLQSLSNK